MYTVCKFILNAKSDTGYSLISRSLGKIAIPVGPVLDSARHQDTFWMVKILNETGYCNRGVLEVEPLYQVAPTYLIAGQFEPRHDQHWVYLERLADLPVLPYMVPQTIKQPYLRRGSSCAVVCVPYTAEDLRLIPPM